MRKGTQLLVATLLAATAACEKQAAPPAGNEVAATPAAAAAGFDGTWKVDIGNIQFNNEKPFTIALKDGTWECSSCLPPFKVAADGKLHPVQRPAADEMSVTVVDDKTVKTLIRKGGKDLGNTTYVAGADGKTLTATIVDAAYEGSEETSRTVNLTRSADAPAGAHAVSGAWAVAKVETMSDAARTFTITTTPDSFGISGNGISYVAKLGGEPVAIKGDPSGAMAAITKVSDTEYLETLTRKGEVIEKNRFLLGADGTMTLESTDPRNGNTSKATATRG